MVLVVTVDPGVTTGYCIASIFDNKPTLLTVGESQMSCLDIFDWLKLRQPDIIICEDFTYRPNMLPGLEMYSRNLIGAIQLYVEMSDQNYEESDLAHAELILQKPNVKNGFYGIKENMKELGVWAKGREHGRDATRHFLQWHNFKGGLTMNNKMGYKLEVV